MPSVILKVRVFVSGSHWSVPFTNDPLTITTFPVRFSFAAIAPLTSYWFDVPDVSNRYPNKTTMIETPNNKRFFLILLIAALRILLVNSIGLLVKEGENKKILIGAGLAFIFGIISSLVGMGGGTFIVPLLLILGLETRNAIATSAFIITFTSLSGFAGHLVFSTLTLDLRVLFYAGLAAFAGAQIGSKVIFKRVSSKSISNLFAIILLFVAGKLLYGIL